MNCEDAIKHEDPLSTIESEAQEIKVEIKSEQVDEIPNVNTKLVALGAIDALVSMETKHEVDLSEENLEKFAEGSQVNVTTSDSVICIEEDNLIMNCEVTNKHGDPLSPNESTSQDNKEEMKSELEDEIDNTDTKLMVIEAVETIATIE
ncbi:hypothetical protein L9F63_021024, partial [Diploptera punctata]